jgi:hypothetical protein
MKCYHHTSRDAVAKCAGPSCGKHICKDCYDSWKVDVGPWAGDPLCYDCATSMVAFNAQVVLESGERCEKIRKNSIIGMIVGGIIGMFLGGAIIGGSTGDPFGGAVFGGWVVAGIAGTIGSLGIKFIFFSRDEKGELDIIPFLFSAIAGPIFCIYWIIKDKDYLAKCQVIAESDKESLRLMEDYFQYTLAMEKADINQNFETLTAQGGELFNNSYAQNVKTKGEKAAQAQLREEVVRIAANGEIIRNPPRRRGTRKAS